MKLSPRSVAALLGLLLAVWLAWPSQRGSVPAPASPVAAATSGGAVRQVLVGSGEVDPAVLQLVERTVDECLPEVRKALNLKDLQRFFVFVHGRRATLPEALVPLLHEDSPAFALLGRRQIHLVWGELLRLGSQVRGVVTHELVHELLDQRCGGHGLAIPRWFHEGLAQHLAGDTYLGGREEDLVWRAAVGRLLPFGELVRGFPDDREAVRIAYAQSYSYVSWLVRGHGLATLVRAAGNVDGTTSFDHALVGATGRTTLQLQDDWRDYLLRRSGAPWRVLLAEWWGLLGIALLPVLVLALRRRLAAGARAAARLETMQPQAEALAASIASQAEVAALGDAESDAERHAGDVRDADAAAVDAAARAVPELPYDPPSPPQNLQPDGCDTRRG